MMVRFATTCDTCNVRSEEYTAWPECPDCGKHSCPAHQIGKTVEGDGDVDAPVSDKAFCADCGVKCETCGDRGVALEDWPQLAVGGGREEPGLEPADRCQDCLDRLEQAQESAYNEHIDRKIDEGRP